MDLLRESDTITQCPYKGRANYYSAVIGEQTVSDIAWTYVFPVPEAPRLERLITFCDERVEHIRQWPAASATGLCLV
jgi:uncharacterized protein (DUF427 family)